jgi:hypothetical protein
VATLVVLSACVAEIATTTAQSPGADPSPSAFPIAPIEDVYRAFDRSGVTGTSFGDPVVLTTHPVADVTLPTGVLVAADPFFLDWAEPYTAVLPPGSHPVSLLVADWPADSDRRNAAAMLRVADGDPVRWELALVADQDPSTLGQDEVFGYGVDAGMGSFTSPEAIAAIGTGVSFEHYHAAMMEQVLPEDGTRPAIDAAALEVDAATGANVVAFGSGIGDGEYPTWMGMDAGDRPIVVLTDFWILDAVDLDGGSVTPVPSTLTPG